MAVKVKICGLTRPEDTAVPADAGASCLGVVFAGGPRLVTVAAAPRLPQPPGAFRSTREAAALGGPEVIDVSSGVETLPGIKDPTKIARFMEAVCGHSAIS